MFARADVVKAFVLLGWLALQGTLIATAGPRPEHAFGFRMFGEASTLKYSLYRVVRAPDGTQRELKCDEGRYRIAKGGGEGVAFDWHDWVKTPALGTFDREIVASYGVAAQRSRLAAAVDSFADQVPADRETARFVIRGYSRRNGGPPEPFVFESHAVNP